MTNQTLKGSIIMIMVAGASRSGVLLAGPYTHDEAENKSCPVGIKVIAPAIYPCIPPGEPAYVLVRMESGEILEVSEEYLVGCTAPEQPTGNPFTNMPSPWMSRHPWGQEYRNADSFPSNANPQDMQWLSNFNLRSPRGPFLPPESLYGHENHWGNQKQVRVGGVYLGMHSDRFNHHISDDILYELFAEYSVSPVKCSFQETSFIIQNASKPINEGVELENECILICNTGAAFIGRVTLQSNGVRAIIPSQETDVRPVVKNIPLEVIHYITTQVVAWAPLPSNDAISGSMFGISKVAASLIRIIEDYKIATLGNVEEAWVAINQYSKPIAEAELNKPVLMVYPKGVAFIGEVIKHGDKLVIAPTQEVDDAGAVIPMPQEVIDYINEHVLAWVPLPA